MQCKSYLPGYYSMRDVNEDTSSSRWSLYYCDKNLPNGQFCNGFLPRVIPDMHAGYDKDTFKQTILEQDAVFKNQVHELHRLYRIQRDLMDEIKRSELHKHKMPVEQSLSLNPMTSQMLSEDSWKWDFPNFPLGNSVSIGPSDLCANNTPCFIKGKSAQASPIQSHSGRCSKDCEILDFRPSKVRRKMLDLQFPADEYIDTEEEVQFQYEKVPESSSSKGNIKFEPDSGVKLFVGFNGNDKKSNSSSRVMKELADLNEPIQVEEVSTPASANFLGEETYHDKFQSLGISAERKPQFVGMTMEILQKSCHESANGILSNQLLHSKGRAKEWMSRMLEAGHNKSKQKSIYQDDRPEMLKLPSQPHGMFNKDSEPSMLLPKDQIKGDFMREKTVYGPERSRELSNYNQHSVPLVASQLHSSFPTVPSDMSFSWAHSVLSKEKSSMTLSQKPLTIQTCLSSPTSLSKYPQSSNLAFGSIMSAQNGFCGGSSSGSKEQPICIGSDHMNCEHHDYVAPERLMGYGSGKFFNTSTHVDVKSEGDMDLNAVLSSSSSNGAIPHQGPDVFDGEGKHEDHGAVIHWLRAIHWSQETETRKVLNQNSGQNITSASSACDDLEVKRTETSKCLSSKKILGVPIFEKPCISKNDVSSFTVCTPLLTRQHEFEEVKNSKMKVQIPDINLTDPADTESGTQIAADAVVEKGTDSNVPSFKNQFDLNSCVSEEEALSTPIVPIHNAKTTTDIDLEVPAFLEIDQEILPPMEEESAEKQSEKPVESLDHRAEDSLGELVKIAAEAIVAISSTSDQSQLGDTTHIGQTETLPNPFHWFVDVAFACLDELQNKSSKVSMGRKNGDGTNFSSHRMDYFEIMTLRLTEIDVEEEYPPKPQIQDDSKVEEMETTSVRNRPRKGQGRRGRQRRDFQRDILPGLASLSRHEVTEDLQTFGGMMRAMGHSWQSSSARRTANRNVCNRGGKLRSVGSSIPTIMPSTVCVPLVQQLSNIEVGLEDRSLTGWGKTTRRPRRPRCPPGNPLASLPVAQ